MVTLLEGRHIHFTKKLDSSSSVTGLQRGVLILGSVMRVCFFCHCWTGDILNGVLSIRTAGRQVITTVNRSIASSFACACTLCRLLNKDNILMGDCNSVNLTGHNFQL